MAASSDIQLPAKWADLAEFIEKASPHGRRKVVIDCDPGVDDAEAIMMLMQAPNVDVVAITCVNGNTNSKQAALNAQWILSLFPEQKVPIYVGADAPLLSPVEDAHYFHGPNGLACPPDADEQHRIATSPSTIQPENAVDALLRLGREYLVTRATPAGRHSRTLNQLAQYHQWQEDNVRQQLAAAVSSEDYDLAADLKHDAYECGRRKVACLHASRHGEDTYPGLDILALGPLTNLALAARLDHGFPATVRSLMVMGGTSKGQGNVPRHPAAEFNCFADPDATAIVLSAYTHTVLITAECCTQVEVPWDTIAQWRSADNPRAVFLNRVAEFSKQLCITKGWPYAPYDPLAAAIYLRPTLTVVGESAGLHHCQVNRHPGPAYAQSVVDINGLTSRAANTWLVDGVHQEAALDIIKTAVQ